jgi:hypothetical protein
MWYRELLGVYTQLQSHGNHADAKDYQQQVLQHKALVQRLERVVLVLDAALVEARLAREAMLLYIQVRVMGLRLQFGVETDVVLFRTVPALALAQPPQYSILQAHFIVILYTVAFSSLKTARTTRRWPRTTPPAV